MESERKIVTVERRRPLPSNADRVLQTRETSQKDDKFVKFLQAVDGAAGVDVDDLREKCKHDKQALAAVCQNLKKLLPEIAKDDWRYVGQGIL